MIQELLFGGSSSAAATVVSLSSAYSGGGERNKAHISNNNNGGIIADATATAACSKSPNEKTKDNNNPEQNLRCPRCDSSDTKFCYYNNYNLTQPRHFCKTCRRYWTKGGALRNVPIGGGCRKNKTSFNSSKPKVYSSNSADHMLLKSGLLDSQESSLHHHMMWPSPIQPQTSHLLAFLRSTPQNPNPCLSPSNHTHLIPSSPLQNSNQHATGFTAMNLLNSQTTSLSGLDYYHCSNFFRNKNNQTLTQPPQLLQVPQKRQSDEVAQQLGRVQQNTSGIQESYQRMNHLSTNSNTKSYSSSGGNNNTNNHTHVVLGNNGVSVSSSSSPTTSSRAAFQSDQMTIVGGGGSQSGLWDVTTQAVDYSAWINGHLPGATTGDGCPL